MVVLGYNFLIKKMTFCGNSHHVFTPVSYSWILSLYAPVLFVLYTPNLIVSGTLVLEFVLFAAAFMYSWHSLVSLWWHAAFIYMICRVQYGLVDWYWHFWRTSCTLNSELRTTWWSVVAYVEFSLLEAFLQFSWVWGGVLLLLHLLLFASSDKLAGRQTPVCVLK